MIAYTVDSAVRVFLAAYPVKKAPAKAKRARAAALEPAE
jgi:hypothetical protein